MDVHRASLSALATALVRAVHTRCDDPPLIEDPFGDRLVSDDERARLLERLLLTLGPDDQERVQAEPDPHRALDLALQFTPGYGGVVVRARYTEERLEEAMGRGVRQYVLLGAGMDTFSFRRPDLAKRLTIIEIDHPATQGLKRARFEAAGLELGANVEWVAADLESEPLAQVLARSLHRAAEPCFLAWLGVTPYLAPEANFATFQAIATATAPESELVFDYIDRDAFDAVKASQEARRMVAERASTEEPFLAGFDPVALAEELASVGLELLEDLDPGEAEARYCAGRADGLRLRAPGHIARARVTARRATAAPGSVPS
jgi:methyltransferase (TIGR00027 family)